MSDINSQIRATIDNFVSELNGLVRQAALEAVSGALGGVGAPAGRGRPRSIIPAAPERARGRGRGAKRTPEELAQLTEGLYEYIAGNPGQGVEAIGKALGIETKELALPIKKLIADGRISTEGQKRATKYFAGGETASKGRGRGRGRKRG
jgi:hypothetical protein